MKYCNKCNTEKSEERFNIDSSRPDGLYCYCKSCHQEKVRDWQVRNPKKQKEYKLKSRYGVNLEDYNKLVEQQDGVCAVCKEKCSSGYDLSVDHCHETGEIRGLLCKMCNLGLGNFRNSTGLLRCAALYLESTGVTK